MRSNGVFVAAENCPGGHGHELGGGGLVKLAETSLTPAQTVQVVTSLRPRPAEASYLATFVISDNHKQFAPTFCQSSPSLAPSLREPPTSCCTYGNTTRRGGPPARARARRP